MSAVGVDQHIKLDTKYFMVKNGSRFKGVVPTPVAPSIGQPVDLSQRKRWRQDSWRGGMGQERWKDPEMYSDGFIDSYSHPKRLRCLQAAKTLTNSAAFTTPGNSDIRFGVRPVNDVDQPRLYVVVTDNVGSYSQVYRFREDLNSGNLQLLYNGPTGAGATGSKKLKIACVYPSWGDEPFRIIFGLSNSGDVFGAVYGMGGNTENLGQTFARPASAGTSYPTAIMNFNKSEYIAYSNGDKGAVVYRNPPNPITAFADLKSKEVKGMAVWNGRLWMLSHQNEGLTRLWVTDGNVTNEAYHWTGNFFGQSIFTHNNALYIGGTVQRYDESKAIAQLWKYNGSSMELIGQFDYAGLSEHPVMTTGYKQRITGLGSWGRFLVVNGNSQDHIDGQRHSGFYLYDPDEDAWHYGGYVQNDDFPDKNAAEIQSFQEYDGRLFIGDKTSGKVHYITNDAGTYTTSMYTSSIFDGGLPLEDKLWTKIAVEVRIPFSPGSVKIDYSIDEGTTWTTAGTIAYDGTNLNRRIVEFPISQKISRTIQLRATLQPGGTQTARTDGTKEGTNAPFMCSPEIWSTEVTYDIVPVTKRFWSFTVLASDGLIGPDGTVDSRNGPTIMSDLWGIYTARKDVTLQDVDGTTYTVRLTSIGESEGLLRFQDLGGRKAELPITLTEV